MGSTSHYKILTSKTFWHPCFSFLEVGFLAAGVSGNSPSCPFPRMKASDSHSRIMGIDFFIPFPFPNFGNAFFSFPSRSRIMGMFFFHSLPVPELRECSFFIPLPFPNYGDGFFHSLPVPELWEWIFLIPFPFPNLQFHRRESKRELDYCKIYQASNFFSFLYISQTNHIKGEIEPRCLKVSD